MWVGSLAGVTYFSLHSAVFDCAAKFQNVSLNQQILQGPDLTNSLTGVLTRFREHPIAIMADIEKNCYQVHVPTEDSRYLRFLW